MASTKIKKEEQTNRRYSSHKVTPYINMGIKQMSMQWMELNLIDQPREGRNMEGEELESQKTSMSEALYSSLTATSMPSDDF